MGWVNHPWTKKNTTNILDQEINPSTEETLWDILSEIVSQKDPKQTLIDTVWSIMYIWESTPWALTSDASWSIIKFDESANPSSIKNGIGTFSYNDCVWDDRATLTYE
jgi:hypothetical protein